MYYLPCIVLISFHSFICSIFTCHFLFILFHFSCVFYKQYMVYFAFFFTQVETLLMELSVTKVGMNHICKYSYILFSVIAFCYHS